MPRGGTPPPPTAAVTIDDGPVEMPTFPPSPHQHAYLHYNGSNAYPELIDIDFAEHAPERPDGWRERAKRLSKKKSFWAVIVLLLVLVICLFAGLGVLWQKGDRGKTDRKIIT